LTRPSLADGLEQAQGAEGVDVAGVFGMSKDSPHVALRAEVVDLVGLHLVEDAGQVGGVGQVAVVKVEAGLIGVRVR
jgi:hypothetical protein